MNRVQIACIVRVAPDLTIDSVPATKTNRVFSSPECVNVLTCCCHSLLRKHSVSKQSVLKKTDGTYPYYF